MKRDKPIAHIAEDGRVHPLEDHLRGTAELASRFAAEFGCGEWVKKILLKPQERRASEKLFDSDGGFRSNRHVD